MDFPASHFSVKNWTENWRPRVACVWRAVVAPVAQCVWWMGRCAPPAAPAAEKRPRGARTGPTGLRYAV
jgi:hypothetical protein